MAQLGFGFMRLPLLDKNIKKSIDYSLLNELVDIFLYKGNKYIDTGYFYHDGFSEVAVKESVVNRHPRDSFIIADKLPVSMIKKKEQIETIFLEQLMKCGVEFFDVYLLHAVSESNRNTINDLNMFDFLRQKKNEGKTKKIGFSFHGKAAYLDELLANNTDVDIVQLQMNYLDWEDPTIESRKCYEIASKYNKQVIVMEPIKGGLLANLPDEAEELLKKKNPNRSAASWALSFVASQKNVEYVLSGMSSINQIAENDLSVKKNISKEEENLLIRAARIVQKSISIPCTSCHYCSKRCPQGIMIPELFSIYNTFKRDPYNQKIVASMYYSSFKKTSGDPRSCIKCGACVEVCPQKISIIDKVKESDDELSKQTLKTMMKYYKKTKPKTK